ncbi:Rpn family recombination-promoting nuclease/putative transposase [Petrotoga sp. DB-2]
MNELVHNPHDLFFKRIFSDKKIARDFLQNYLPQEAVEIVDLDYLTPENNSHVDENLRESLSDMLYKTKIKGQDGYIYILMEHKSYIEGKVIFQLLRYITSIWEEKYDPKTKKVPIIMPMVIYHGREIWNVETNLSNMVQGIEDLPNELKTYLPTYRYEICDFSIKRKKRIIGLTATKVAIEAMRAGTAMTKEEFKEGLSRVFEYIKQLPEEQVQEWFELCMIYLLNVREDVTIEEIIKVQKEIMPGRGEIVMTIAEKLKNEGKLEGERKGKLEGEKELIIEILNQRFGEDFDKSLENKIRKANEETINQIKKNILSITLEELKELLK